MLNKKTAQTKREEVAPGIKKSRWKASGLSTQSDLYQKHVKVMPKRVKGIYRRIKWLILFILLGIYYLIPFIRWDRGPQAPNQAVLVDFAHSRFYFFFIKIWPQEVYFITGLLILAAMGLFLVTALFGRIWCGYTCPQTVWTDLFVAVERFFEGDRNARIKLERSPWTKNNKILKKIGKHITWILIAMATGGAWILYFHDAPTIVKNLFTGHAPVTSYVFLGIMTFTTYALAGFMREQVCTYMCPWPRIQASMIDEESLNVTYRYDRGEPRGPHKKGASWEGRGDCIDCHQCIAVCPTGIDIRDGAQLECIGCALCIDACNGIMEKINRPKGLIAYDTDVNIQRRLKGEEPRFNLVRARTIIYAMIVFVISSVILYGLANRTTIEMNIMRDRVPNFVRLSDGSIRNGYTVKILNKSSEDKNFIITAEDIINPNINIIGVKPTNGQYILHVPADKTLGYKLYLSLEDVKDHKNREVFNFLIKDTDTGHTAHTETMFITGTGKE
ncbi:MAG: cytochrome c oxidase accessory protein CcoG [Robiginitomaculum sp.]